MCQEVIILQGVGLANFNARSDAFEGLENIDPFSLVEMNLSAWARPTPKTITSSILGGDPICFRLEGHASCSYLVVPADTEIAHFSVAIGSRLLGYTYKFFLTIGR
jgi:hypothetical protein